MSNVNKRKAQVYPKYNEGDQGYHPDEEQKAYQQGDFWLEVPSVPQGEYRSNNLVGFLVDYPDNSISNVSLWYKVVAEQGKNKVSWYVEYYLDGFLILKRPVSKALTSMKYLLRLIADEVVTSGVVNYGRGGGRLRNGNIRYKQEGTGFDFFYVYA